MNAFKESGFCLADKLNESAMMEQATTGAIGKFIRDEIGYEENVEVFFQGEYYDRRMVVNIGPPFNISVPLDPTKDDWRDIQPLLFATDYWQDKVKQKQRIKAFKRFGVPKQTIGRRR